VTRSDAAYAGSVVAMRPRTDLAIALAIAVAAAALYAGFGLRLAQGQYLEFYNLAFDFDPPRYVALMGLAEYERGNVKHPLVLLLRSLAWPLLAAGLSPKAAATLVMAAFGGATVGVVFLFLRAIAAARLPALALAVLFAVSGGQAFTAIIAEAYGPAAFGIACVWLLTVHALTDPRRGRGARIAAAVFGFGMTTTNVVQSFLAEALVWLRHRGPVGALRPMIAYGVTVAAIAALLTAAVWADLLLAVLADPLSMVKELYWARTKGERVGPAEVLLRLLGYTVVSPEYDAVRLSDGFDMLDFRTPRFGPLAGVAFVLWHLFWVAGVVAALRNPATRWLAVGLAATLAFNILFHVDFQFRGSLYLYAGHTHFLVFALGAGLAPLLRPHGPAMYAYVAVVLLLAVLVGVVTLDRVADLVTRFDEVRIDCPAPCRE